MSSLPVRRLFAFVGCDVGGVGFVPYRRPGVRCSRQRRLRRRSGYFGYVGQRGGTTVAATGEPGEPGISITLTRSGTRGRRRQRTVVFDSAAQAIDTLLAVTRRSLPSHQVASTTTRAAPRAGSAFPPRRHRLSIQVDGVSAGWGVHAELEHAAGLYGDRLHRTYTYTGAPEEFLVPATSVRDGRGGRAAGGAGGLAPIVAGGVAAGGGVGVRRWARSSDAGESLEIGWRARLVTTSCLPADGHVGDTTRRANGFSTPTTQLLGRRGGASDVRRSPSLSRQARRGRCGGAAGAASAVELAQVAWRWTACRRGLTAPPVRTHPDRDLRSHRQRRRGGTQTSEAPAARGWRHRTKRRWRAA